MVLAELGNRVPDGSVTLDALGLSVELLHAAARAGLTARASRTGLAPRNAPGTDLYSFTVEELRVLLVPAGWEPQFVAGQERTVSPDGRVAIIVSTGDGPVGEMSDVQPRTAHPKGPLMRNAVAANLGFVQVELALGIAHPQPAEGAAIPVWVLLVKVEGDALHLELSLPDRVGDDDRVVSWSERILLPPIALGELARAEDAAPETIDVPVQPR